MRDDWSVSLFIFILFNNINDGNEDKYLILVEWLNKLR